MRRNPAGFCAIIGAPTIRLARQYWNVIAFGRPRSSESRRDTMQGRSFIRDAHSSEIDQTWTLGLYSDDANPGAKMPGIGGDRHHRLGRGRSSSQRHGAAK